MTHDGMGREELARAVAQCGPRPSSCLSGEEPSLLEGEGQARAAPAGALQPQGVVKGAEAACEGCVGRQTPHSVALPLSTA